MWWVDIQSRYSFIRTLNVFKHMWIAKIESIFYLNTIAIEIKSLFLAFVIVMSDIISVICHVFVNFFNILDFRY
jgi:hypothetical protein